MLQTLGVSLILIEDATFERRIRHRLEPMSASDVKRVQSNERTRLARAAAREEPEEPGTLVR
jgi:hypothetical protein